MKGFKMKKSLFLWQLCGFAFTSLAGTLLHYLFEWSNESPLAAVISGVNESTWEHMKLLFVPMFIFALIQSLYFKRTVNFFCIKLCGILLGILIIPFVFYTYNGAFGKSPDWFNIALFFFAAAATYIFEYRLFIKNQPRVLPEFLCFVILIIIASLFVVFTFITPKLPLFKDPIDQTYGYISQA